MEELKTLDLGADEHLPGINMMLDLVESKHAAGLDGIFMASDQSGRFIRAFKVEVLTTIPNPYFEETEPQSEETPPE